MPSFSERRLSSHPRLAVARVSCDGRDDRRPPDEASCGDRLWLVLGGQLTLRTPAARRVLDPSTMALLRHGTPYRVTHQREGLGVTPAACRREGRIGEGPAPYPPVRRRTPPWTNRGCPTVSTPAFPTT